MELSVVNSAGVETGKTVELVPSIFSIEPNDHAIYLDVKQHLANKRQGTAKTKHRGEVSGSTRKLLRQKGTGGARHGSIKAPIYVGGGRVFGPIPKDYSFKLNKKVKALARYSALTYKAKDNNIVIVDDIKFEAPKTKEFIALQNNLKIQDKKSLIVLAEQNKNVYLSSRNLDNSKVVTISELTTYDIVNASTLLFSEKSLALLQKQD
jgi:large subunit ribosomal protein L4